MDHALHKWESKPIACLHTISEVWINYTSDIWQEHNSVWQSSVKTTTSGGVIRMSDGVRRQFNNLRYCCTSSIDKDLQLTLGQRKGGSTDQPYILYGSFKLRDVRGK